MNIALVGATGAVGQEFLRVFEMLNFPISSLVPLASARSAGKVVKCKGVEYEIREISADAFEGVDVAFFSAGGDISREFAPKARDRGALVIDNSSAFRMDAGVPLIIPEVNPDAARAHKGIISNPNCSTIIALVPLAPIYREAGLARFIVSTYQAVSGTGAAAMAELESQLDDIRAGREVKIEAYPHQIAMNALPHVDVFLDSGFTREEMKMVHETHKILSDDSIKISATCVRVPIMRSHSESICFETKRKVSADAVRDILANAKGVTVVDEPSEARYPLALSASGKINVEVGRIREDAVFENGLSMWVVGDQLLKGAALNAVQIASLVGG